MTDSFTGFYSSYAQYKSYQTPQLGRKDIERFDAEIWKPAACSPYHAFLEIGCGTGAFLSYLAHKKVNRFQGIDHDPNLAAAIPEEARPHFACANVWDFLHDEHSGPFDRVVLLDVLEHFPPTDAVRLLEALRHRLNEGAKVLIKVPNASSPWALQWQFGDLTHCAMLTPLSLKQLAGAAGFRLVDVWAQRRGSRRRMITDAIVHRFLSWALLNPPPIWSANFYGLLEPQ